MDIDKYKSQYVNFGFQLYFLNSIGVYTMAKWNLFLQQKNGSVYKKQSV